MSIDSVEKKKLILRIGIVCSYGINFHETKMDIYLNI